MTERRTTEADRLITAALVENLAPAPRKLRERLEREHLRPRASRWGWAYGFGAGLAVAAAFVLLFVLPRTREDLDTANGTVAVAKEAIDDHMRILVSTRPLDVAVSNIHEVKPWFAGKVEFTPPVSFIGDDEFPLKGGQLSVFDGHKAATFVYGHLLHVITLTVYPNAPQTGRTETTQRGFHVISWQNGGLGMVITSDLNWDDLRAFEHRVK